MTSFVRRHSAGHLDRARATSALLAFLVALAGLAAICQTSVASPRSSVARHVRLSGAPHVRSFALAPMNPAFMNYLKLRSVSRLRPGPAEHGLGLIPSPIDFSYMSRGHGSLARTSYPASYDLRALGKVRPVEDQGQYGTCWAFAAMGSLESCLLPADPESFSEDNLVLNSGFDYSFDHSPDPSDYDSAYNMGGFSTMAVAYLARWSGPVAASADSYADGSTPPGLVAEKHVQEALYLAPRTGPLDNDAIKSAVMAYGSVDASIYADDGMCSSSWSDYYDPATDAYYYFGSEITNHDVNIVGWDDNYSAANFATTPPGNGAFIVRNSWGTGWGAAGYFYVSYYGTDFARQDTSVVFDDAEPTDNFSGIYQYDPLGWTGSLGYSSNTAWFANKFTAGASEPLTAVSFYAYEPASSYTLYVGGSTSSLTADGSGSLSAAGYHTVSLSSPLPLTNGQAFVVAVRLTTPGYNYPIPLESNIPGYTSNATSSPGQSFVSSTGASWTDLTTLGGCSQANVCLKVFTRPAAGDLTPPTTTATGLQSSAGAAWQRTLAQVTLAASDNVGGSGVKGTYYTIDGTQHTYAAPFTLGDGAHAVTYWSDDKAANVETPHTGYANVDTTSPATSDNSDGLSHSSFHLVLTPTDPFSGVATTEYRIDGGPWRLGRSVQLSIHGLRHRRLGLRAGSHTVSYYSTDNAGNVESVKSCQVILG